METPIQRLEVSAYTVPTDVPESDGTYAWDSTTLVLVEVTAGNVQGLGYTYADTATAQLIKDKLAEVVLGCDAMAVPGTWALMVGAIRNLGRPGIASMAIAAVDAALWDVKARLLGVPLVTLLGAMRDSVPVYGSGGFTSYTMTQLRDQCSGWVADGMPLSAHCWPSLHAHPCCALTHVRHVEYFYDHASIEHMLFDGVLTPVHSAQQPDLSRPGLGLAFKHADAARYAM